MGMMDEIGVPGDAPARRGGETVAMLDALPPTQILSILLLRDWCEGPEGRTRIAVLLEEGLGAYPGQKAAGDWDAFMRMLTERGRRPLMRHATTCRCVGADEAVIANLLELAASGERDDAMLVASLLVPGDRLLYLMVLAEAVGVAIRRTDLRLRRARAPARTLH